MKKLSVVIVNWNTGDLLAACLKSLYADLPDLSQAEVFVVDNASSDGSAQAAVMRYGQTVLIENESNPGFAAANNQALQQASGEYTLLLNPDTQIHPGAIACLVSYLDSHPEIGAVGPMLLNPDGSLQYSCSPEPSLRGEIQRLFHLRGARPDGYYPMETWDMDEPHSADVLLGAAILARSKALEAVGWFDTDYFMYSEEVDLCLKLRRAGWRLCWVPQARITHYGGQSTRLAAGEMFLQLYRSKVVYFRRNHGPGAAWAYKLILLAAGMVRVAAGVAAPLAPQAEREKRTEVARNYRQLLARLATL